APAPAPVTKKKVEPVKGTVAEVIKNPNVAPPLPARDPFSNPLMGPDSGATTPTPVSQPTPISKPHPSNDGGEPAPLPRAGIDKSGGFSDGGKIAPLKITDIPEEKFGYSLSGVML